MGIVRAVGQVSFVRLQPFGPVFREPDIFGLKFARFFSPDVRIPLRIAFPFIGGPGRAVKFLAIIAQAETPVRPALELGLFLAGHGITTL